MMALSSIVPIGGCIVVGRDDEGHGVNLFRPRDGDGFADSVHVVRIIVGEDGKRHCYIAPHMPAEAEGLRRIISAMGLDIDAMSFQAWPESDDGRAVLDELVNGVPTEGSA